MALKTKAGLLLVSVAACALLTSPGLAQTVPASTLSIVPYDVATPIDTLVSAIQAANSGITILSSSYIGITGQGGTYTGFDLPSTAGGPTITAPNGVLLTSGSADLPLTNTVTAFNHTTGTGANAQLTALLDGVPTNDQNVLSLTFTVNNPQANAVKAGFVFGTDEYPEYIANYNDTIGFFVDGKNYAVFPNGSLVSINESTSSNFNNNNVQSSNGTPPYGIEYDGISNLLTVDGLLDPTLTTHTLTIAIADVNDSAVDSGVFIGGLKAALVAGGGGIVTASSTIDTTHGDLAPAIFSLGSPAAEAATVQFDGGTLRMTGGSFAGNIVTAPVVISASNGTVDTTPASGGFSGVVSGPGSLTITGSNTFSLSGANTYTGGTILSGGTLLVSTSTASQNGVVSSSIGSGPLAMADGTTLKETTGVTLGNAAILSGTAGFETSDTAADGDGLIYNGVISGTGSLVKTGASGLRLTAANTYSGGTVIQAGHIGIADDDALGTGTLTFAGGSLRPHVDGLTVGNAALLSTDGTIDTRGHDLTYAGAIAGGGQLIKAGQYALTLTNADSYTGGTALNAGTLALGNSGALGTGPLTVNAGVLQAAADGLVIGNGVTLAAESVTVDTQANALTLSGAISGAGQLAKVGAGTLTLSGPNAYAGGTDVLAGTLAVGSSTALGTGPVSLQDGTALSFVADGLTLANAIDLPAVDPTIDSGSGFATLSGPITGPGQLTKTGTGTLDLTGTSTNTGPTEVTAGTLQVDGALLNSTVTVDDGATLGGRGSVAGVIVGGGGRLAPSSAQPLTITGNLQLLTGATYEVTVNPDGTNGKLAVGGSVDLGGAALSVLAGSGTFAARTYTLLTAGTLLPGTTFGSVTTATSLALLRPQVNYDYADNDVTLTLNPVDFKTIAATPNQAAVAGAIQNLGPSNGLYDAVVGLDQAQARQAFRATSGVTHANTQTVITSFARTSSTLLLDRLWDVSGSGLSAQQVLDQFAPDRLPALVRCYGPAPDPVPAAAPATYTAWGEAFGTFGHTDATPNAGGLDRSLGGFILGIDTPLDRIGGDKWRAGLAGGYTNTSFKSPLDGGSGTVQSVFGSLYGGARYGAVDLRLGTVAGGTFIDARRDVAFGGVPLFNEVERSHNTGYTVQTFGEVGYRIPAGNVVFEPIAGAAYLHSHQDGFTEKGGLAALTVAAQDTDLGTTTLGFRAEAQPFKDLPIVAHALLGWQHAIGDVSPATTLAFASAPLDTFSVIGTPIDRDALAAEAALDYRVSSVLDVGLTYVGQVGATAADHSVKGRLEYRF